MPWIIVLIILLIILFGFWLFLADKKTLWKSNIGSNIERLKITPKDLELLPIMITEEKKLLVTDEICTVENNQLAELPKSEINEEIKYSSKGEKETCEAAERIFGKPFRKERPEWLKSPLTGRNLEIDCVNHELKIAIEYNGIQHYVYPNFLGMTREQFDSQLQRDKFKAETLESYGYYFIVVPYTVPLASIEKYIGERHPDNQLCHQ